MGVVVFDSSAIYFDTAKSLKEKIAKIDAIIDGIFAAATSGAANGAISEYWLDDGQTKIKEVFRNPEAALAAVKVWEAQRNYYLNKLNGNKIRLVDSRNFPVNRRNNGRC